MKAMIFAAGLGTRLKPLTDNKPKALVEYQGYTLLEIIIRKLISFNISDIIINVHHFADLIEDYVKSRSYFGINITFSDERELLLNTGGGLKKACFFFNDNQPFYIYNVDILSDIDLDLMMEKHKQNNSLVTLAVKKRETSRQLIFDKNGFLVSWKNVITGEEKRSRKQSENEIPLAFSGIQIIEPEIFKLIAEDGVFSIIDLYLRLARDYKISYYCHDDSEWLDLGKKENFAITNDKLLTKIVKN